MSWTLPTVALEAETLSASPSFGGSLDLLDVREDHAVQWTASVQVGDFVSGGLQGSLDGVEWFGVAGSSFGPGTASASTGTIRGITVARGIPARFVRVTASAAAGAPALTAVVTSR